jgi:hypothetical protein
MIKPFPLIPEMFGVVGLGLGLATAMIGMDPLAHPATCLQKGFKCEWVGVGVGLGLGWGWG